MTKADEKARLAAFILDLPPDSYLYSILSEIRLEIENAITNDFGFISFSARIEEMRQHRKEIGELIAARDALAKELRSMTTMQSKLADSIAEIRATARKMAAA